MQSNRRASVSSLSFLNNLCFCLRPSEAPAMRVFLYVAPSVATFHGSRQMLKGAILMKHDRGVRIENVRVIKQYSRLKERT